MGKYLFGIAIFSFLLNTVAAQKAELWVKKSDKGLYLDHKVVPKESFYSVGRKFNITPKDLADFNKLDMNKGLFIDQVIKIPLNADNFDQQGNSGAPVYYKNGGDDLEKISSFANNVPVDKLMDWNDISSAGTVSSSQVIVGFLKGTGFSSITIKPKPRPVQAVVKTKKKKDPVTIVNEEPKTEKPEEKKADPVVISKPEVKNDPQGMGYFKTHFEQQARLIPPVKTVTVTSGIFKTTSGWEDAKYYMLIDSVQPGMIVKVTNPANNKSVFAKVLGQMSGIRQNAGLDIRISNAAASVLEIGEDDKFIVNVNY